MVLFISDTKPIQITTTTLRSNGSSNNKESTSSPRRLRRFRMCLKAECLRGGIEFNCLTGSLLACWYLAVTAAVGNTTTVKLCCVKELKNKHAHSFIPLRGWNQGEIRGGGERLSTNVGPCVPNENAEELRGGFVNFSKAKAATVICCCVAFCPSDGDGDNRKSSSFVFEDAIDRSNERLIQTIATPLNETILARPVGDCNRMWVNGWVSKKTSGQVQTALTLSATDKMQTIVSVIHAIKCTVGKFVFI